MLLAEETASFILMMIAMAFAPTSFIVTLIGSYCNYFFMLFHSSSLFFRSICTYFVFIWVITSSYRQHQIEILIFNHLVLKLLIFKIFKETVIFLHLLCIYFLNYFQITELSTSYFKFTFI